MSENWELSAVNPPPPSKENKRKKPASKVNCSMSKWKLNSKEYTLNTKHNLKEKNRPSSTQPPQKRKPLHSTRQLPIGFMEILFLKLAVINFALD
jgi:hypothetical protein